jgi:hypothetical protein
MAVSEEQRERNRDREAQPRFVANIMRRHAREAAREEVLAAVSAVVKAGAPGWCWSGDEAAAYQAEVERLFSRI